MDELKENARGDEFMNKDSGKCYIDKLLDKKVIHSIE